MRGSQLSRKPQPNQQRTIAQKQQSNIPEPQNAGSAFARRPKTLTCTICGREFGTQSLEIHQRTCIQKYQTQIDNLPVAHTRNMPSVKQMQANVEQEKQYRQQGGGRPQTGDQPIRGGKGKFDQYQQQPTIVQSLVQCRRCGRRFNPDRIMKHESVCIGPPTDISKVKEQQIQINRNATKHLRPKVTGKWRQQHAEFINSMRQMRLYEQQQRSGQGQKYGQNKQSGSTLYQKNTRSQQPISQSGYNGYNQQPKQSNIQSGYGQQSGNGQQPRNSNNYGYDDNQYAKSSIITSKKTQLHQQQYQMDMNPPQQQRPVISQKRMQPQQQYQAPQQGRASSSRPIAQKNNGGGGGGFSNPSYGRNLPPGMGGGGGDQKMAHSNVSTFSLFTGDGRPADYSRFQRDNPYAKQ